MATTKPLTIAVHPSLSNMPWVKELQDKGHHVEFGIGDEFSGWQCDLILGPNCARFLPGMEQFLDSFIKGTRAIKYKGKKDE